MAPTGHSRSESKEKSSVLTSDGFPLSGSMPSAAVKRSIQNQQSKLSGEGISPSQLKLTTCMIGEPSVSSLSGPMSTLFVWLDGLDRLFVHGF